MRKALIGLILAATATVPAAAWAQDWHHDNGRGERGHNDGGQRGQRPAQAQQAPRQAQQAPQGQFVARPRGDNNVARGNWQGRNEAVNRGGNYQGRGGANWQGGNENRGNWQGRNEAVNRGNFQGRGSANFESRGNWRGNDGGKWRGDDRGNWRGGNRGGGANWNRGWRNDNRYDWRGYRNSNRGIFHVGPYYSPYRGYGYNRFSIGVFLDPFFYDQRYWIGDPWEYRLPPAEPGTEWVRYYNDVLLVDVDTGEVLDTIYDFFW